MPLNSLPFGGLVLAGGKSARMGTDKALLQYRKKTMLAHMTGFLSDLGAAPVLTSGRAGGLVDLVPQAGPAAGVIALLDYAAKEDAPAAWLVLPVDMPLLTSDMLCRLLQTEGDAVHFADHTLPFALRLSPRVKDVFGHVRSELDSEKGLSLWRILQALGASVLTPSKADTTCLANVNTSAEWAELQRSVPPP